MGLVIVEEVLLLWHLGGGCLPHDIPISSTMVGILALVSGDSNLGPGQDAGLMETFNQEPTRRL